MAQMKPKQVRVYLRNEELQVLSELVERTGLRDTYIMSLLCVAALRAVKKAEYKLQLPLEFRVT